MKKYLRIPLLLSLLFLFGGWGSNGHKVINGKTVLAFPQEMEFFKSWKSMLELHGSDADNRKGSDPSEGPKHYIDIDNYPEFIATGTIPQSYDSIIALYGFGFVEEQGLLPWAILRVCDSLTSTFMRRDYDKAVLFAADLGHYTGDAHMPLHLTKNYNGQLTGQTGIHSRYESTMINRYYTLISYNPDSAEYIDDVPGFVFQFIYSNYHYVDSLLSAESTAKSLAGGSTSSDLYYQKLWELTRDMTTLLFKGASTAMASLIYTSWVDAGKPSAISSVGNSLPENGTFVLLQNYPNPFNPATTITYSLPSPEWVTIMIYDIKGELISCPVNSYHTPGTYNLFFSAEGLASGTYICKASVGAQVIFRKMVLLK